jgi:hypothetical protein
MRELEKMLVDNGVPAKDAKVIAILNENGVGLKDSMQGTLVKGILNTLAIYESTNVWYENGRYDQTPHSMLTATYAADHKFIATIKSSEIYNEQEHKQNMVEASKANWLD